MMTYATPGEKFWIEDPKSIFYSMTLMPSCGMTDPQRLNAITRLIIVIAVILFFIPLASWWLFLIMGLFLVGLIYWSSKVNKGTQIIENYRCFYRPKYQSPSQNQAVKERPKINLRPR